MNKKCSKCKEIKDLNFFHNLKTGKFGKHSNCKLCRNNYRKNLKYLKPINGTIKCEKCHIIKNVIEFYADKSKSTGLQSYCKSCQKEKIYESYSKLEGYITKILKLLKTKCIKQKLEINLSQSDILDIFNNQNKKCALTNELLTYYNGPNLTDNNYETKFNISIIKIDDSIKYQSSNILLVGDIINKMKKNIPLPEFKRLCELIINSKLTII